MKVSIVTLAVLVAQSFAEDDGSWANIVSIGQRPYYLVDEMKPSSVRDKLGMSSSCLFLLLPLI